MNYEKMWHELKLKMKENNISTKLLDEIEKEYNKVKYYLIIGGYSGYPIGRCTSHGIEDVNEEEPDAKFYEITETEFYFESEDKIYKKKGIDWMKESKFYNEIK